MKRLAVTSNQTHDTCAASALALSYNHCVIEAFQDHLCRTTFAVHIEGWWLSSCPSCIAEDLLHKPGAMGSISSDSGLFTFPHNIHNPFSFGVRQESKRLLFIFHRGLEGNIFGKV